MSEIYLPLSPHNLYLTLGEFLKAWLNIVAHSRNIYPPESFTIDSITSFGISIPVNRHPNVIAWQNQFIENVLEQLLTVQEKNSVSTVLSISDDSSSSSSSSSSLIPQKIVINRIKAISLVIVTDDKLRRPLERFVINLSQMTLVSQENMDKEFDISDELNWETVYEEFRACIYELLSCLRDENNIKNSQSVLSDSQRVKKTFEMFLETEKNLDVTNSNDSWILNSSIGEDKKIINGQKTKLSAIRPVNVGPLRFSYYSEKVL